MNILTDWLFEHFQDVSPKDFYRTVFPAGELAQRGEHVSGKYTAIVIGVTGRKLENGKAEIKRYSITDDLNMVDTVCDTDDFCLCSPLSYAGKTRTAENARMVYAIAVDVDRVRVDREEDRPEGLINLWERHVLKVQRLPKPTFIVSSGSGLHLYFVLDRPIPLFKNTIDELQDFKRELTRLIWHDTIVDIKSTREIQQEGIYQGFRMPGTVTKYGTRAVAFRTGDRVSMDYLNSFVNENCKVKHFAYKSNLTRADAAIKYPEWYERRVQRKEKRGQWATNRAVYDWWLRKITEGATVGHRYYCMLTLAMYARKCSQYDEKKNPNPVTREELERDCFSLVDRFDALTDNDKNHFDNGDVIDALEAFDDKWITYPNAAISFRSGISIQANRRNGRDQETHLKIARATQAIVDPDGQWHKFGNGRKSKRDQVQSWRREHPNGRKVDCIRDTGLSRSTIVRHWE